MGRKYRSFSLIEVMVVLVIIGILSALAVPNYIKYMTKSKISEGMVVVNAMNKIIADYYSETGNFPPASHIAKYFNTTTLWGTSIVFNYSNVGSIDISTDGSRALYYGIGFNFDVGASGRRYLYVAVKNINNILIFKCGIWDLDSPAGYHIVDPTYLPSGCTETDVSTFWGSR